MELEAVRGASPVADGSPGADGAPLLAGAAASGAAPHSSSTRSRTIVGWFEQIIWII